MNLRAVALLIGFLLMTGLQSGFVTALPGWFSFTPLMFVTAVYMIQHHGQEHAALWIIGYGLLLDLWHIGLLPLETVSYSIAALAALLLSRHVFSNRSFYGVMACVVSALLILLVSELLIATFLWLRNDAAIIWIDVWGANLRTIVLAIALVSILFPFGTQFRRILSRVFLLSRRRETY